jgi:hypothetical protein
VRRFLMIPVSKDDMRVAAQLPQHLYSLCGLAAAAF